MALLARHRTHQQQIVDGQHLELQQAHDAIDIDWLPAKGSRSVVPFEKGPKQKMKMDKPKASTAARSSRQVAPLVSFDIPAPAVATVYKGAPPDDPEPKVAPPPSILNSGLRRKHIAKSTVRVAPDVDAA